MTRRFLTMALACTLALPAVAQKKKKNDDGGTPVSKTSTAAFKWREVGPALTSGRIADLAVDPTDFNTWYIAAASGGVWKTTNHGVTMQSVFDGEDSYSIGCVTIDPNNRHTIWVGTGENNNQRSVAYGDGVYRSDDGGQSWKNMGLKNSEHIGMIKVHPANSQVVFVAAYGPLWSAGGDRGLYQTADGGTTWNKVLEVDEHTGINEVHFDPRNPNIMYATAHQRRRHVWTYISGGPSSALYQSTDGGKTWNKLSNGLPGGDVGRIALAISPVNPDVVYACVEGHGFYRSSNRGASFSRMSDHYTSGNYYVELIPHPTDVNTVYSMDTYAQVTTDGGKSFSYLGERNKHVDNHCMWINPTNPAHMLMGCDGGLYEPYDQAKTWLFYPNLPITQFYRVAVDNDAPFYNIYGGTQDNFSLGGPSRTTNAGGIHNLDWFVTQTGDGFESQIDPTNPNIVYAQYQYGGLARYDKLSGEAVSIRPEPGKDEPAYRWNWDAPLLISPHKPERLFFCANLVFMSDDRGNNWKVISPDLTRKIDRNTLEVMGKVWSMDAVAKNQSTSIYGNIVSFAESPKKQGLIYAGTDDGLVHVSEDLGGSWSKVESFSGVPANTYVQQLLPSLHDENVVYAAFNNHKNGDFKPYLLKSTNKGRSYTSIAGNLPERGTVYAIAEDHENPNLLFAGTEFGIFYTADGGKNWSKLGSGLPTIAVKDIDIQRRENDLVLATFGRGFWVLDDYSPLRKLSDDLLNKPAAFLEGRDGLVFMETSPLGYGSEDFLGATFFKAENPPVGAVLTYHVKEVPKGLKAKRKEAEKTSVKGYPTPEEIRAEDREEGSYLLLVISDEGGNEVRRIPLSASAGLNRTTWDGRATAKGSIPRGGGVLTNSPDAYLCLPGTYQASLWLVEEGKATDLGAKTSFKLTTLNEKTFAAKDPKALRDFQELANTTRRDLQAVNRFVEQASKNLQEAAGAIRTTPGADMAYLEKILQLQNKVADLEIGLYGDNSLGRREFEVAPSLNDRMSNVVWNSWYYSGDATGIQSQDLTIVRDALPGIIAECKSLEQEIQGIQSYISSIGGPILNNQLPVFSR